MTELLAHNNFDTNLHMSELLNKELYLDGHYHPNLGGITHGGMTNHYPMTILSMHELGASDQQLRDFSAQWPRHRALINEHLSLIDQHQLTPQNWHLYLGQSKKLKEFRRVFFEQMSESDAANVLTDALSQMQRGLPMGLFHPLIKLSFAALHGDKGLLADALAYMAIRYKDIYQAEVIQHTAFEKPLNEQSHSPQPTALQNWSNIRQLKQKNELPVRLTNLSYAGSISVCEKLCSSTTVHKLAQNNGFVISTENLKNSIQQVTNAAVQLYLSEPSLTTLHAVTASQSLADLTHRFANNEHACTVFTSLWHHFWVWLSALFIEKGCTLALNQTIGAKTDWLRLSKMALNTNEVHIIKMVYSCKWLFENIDADPLYQKAAQTMLNTS